MPVALPGRAGVGKVMDRRSASAEGVLVPDDSAVSGGAAAARAEALFDIKSRADKGSSGLRCHGTLQENDCLPG